MTIRARNTILKIFAIISASLLGALIFYFCMGFFFEGVQAPENPRRLLDFKLLHRYFPFSASFPLALAAIFFTSLYVTVNLFILNLGFIKTQALEITYFAIFLLGLQVESLRLLLPLFGLWRTTSSLLILIGRTVIAGRMLCTLSLFLSSLFSESRDSTYIERNFLIILLVSVGVGAFIPMDTSVTTTTCAVMWGLRGAFLGIRIFIMIATLVSMTVSAYQRFNPQLKGMIIGYALVMFGYITIISADCLFLFILGSSTLTVGTVFYLWNLHKLYLWR